MQEQIGKSHLLLQRCSQAGAFGTSRKLMGRHSWYLVPHGRSRAGTAGTPGTLTGRHSWYSMDAHGQAHLVLHGCSWAGGGYEEVEARQGG